MEAAGRGGSRGFPPRHCKAGAVAATADDGASVAVIVLSAGAAVAASAPWYEDMKSSALGDPAIVRGFLGRALDRTRWIVWPPLAVQSVPWW